MRTHAHTHTRVFCYLPLCFLSVVFFTVFLPTLCTHFWSPAHLSNNIILNTVTVTWDKEQLWVLPLCNFLSQKATHSHNTDPLTPQIFDECCLLGCYTASAGGKVPTFQRILLSPSSGWTYPNDGGSRFLLSIGKLPPDYTAPHPQQTVIFTVIVVRTPDIEIRVFYL